MENMSRALVMAFSMIMFVIAIAYSMYLINHLMSTSEVLLDSVSTKNYYDNIEVGTNGINAERQVGIDTIVSTLYRYYKESYAVKIYDTDSLGNHNLIQLFDITVEAKIASSDPDYVDSIYGTKKSNEKPYMFGAPWSGSAEHQRLRIDYFLNGTKGYIKDTLVDYSNISFLKNFGDKTFTETFVEYAYEGETISTANGLETITGNKQESSKIIITYTEQLP